MNEHDYDFVIVGARCAGAATARLLAHSGARVLLVDRGALGADTLSTSYLMRGAVLQLSRWGLLPQLIAAGTPPVRATYFHYASQSMKIPIRPSQGVDALYAPRRTLLDPMLVRAAEAAGVETRFGARVDGLLRDDDGRVRGVELVIGHRRAVRVSAGMVIGADGLWSSVARWVKAGTYRHGKHGAACLYGYFEGLGLDAYHWHYADGVGAGVAPTDGGLYTVFAGGPRELVPDRDGDRFGCMLRIVRKLSSQLAAQLAAARREGAMRMFPGRPGVSRVPYGPGWALVGDAGYFRDPNTAHGISDALRDAELLANALTQGREAALEHYQHTRDAATERLMYASDELAGGGWDEARLDVLLREASEGMREGARVIDSFARASQPAASNLVALHQRSAGTPFSRLETRTDSMSGLE
ncbi:MAG TPA: NAD(P)/FAD-dependent oxidoreductase [Polyangiales bacterium]|nr:NAD(P)/FAD-dependent oxidoreductase [Polyangiales bacterium]